MFPNVTVSTFLWKATNKKSNCINFTYTHTRLTCSDNNFIISFVILSVTCHILVCLCIFNCSFVSTHLLSWLYLYFFVANSVYYIIWYKMHHCSSGFLCDTFDIGSCTVDKDYAKVFNQTRAWCSVFNLPWLLF